MIEATGAQEDTLSVSVGAQLERLTDRLVVEYADTAPAEEVRGLVEAAVVDLGEPRVLTYVPVLVDRAVRAELRQRPAELRS